MQVLGVGDEDEEAEDDGQLQQDERGLDRHVGAVAERRQPVAHDLRGERAMAVGEVAGVDLRAAVEKQRHDH